MQRTHPFGDECACVVLSRLSPCALHDANPLASGVGMVPSRRTRTTHIHMKTGPLTNLPRPTPSSRDARTIEDVPQLALV